MVLSVFNADFRFLAVLNDFCSQTVSECMPSTSRTNCFQTTPTLWCQAESLWPSLTWHGRSWNSFTPRIITPAMPGRPARTHTRALSEWLLSHTEWVLIVFLRFFTYGDLPLEQHLRQIEEEALSKFECIDPNTEVPAQPRWSTPVSWYISPDVSSMTTVSTQSRFSSCD